MVTSDDSLFERQTEVEALRAYLSTARTGPGEIVMIMGQPGVGKSRLLDQAHHLVDSTAFRVLRGRGVPLEQEYPFGLVRQLYEPLLLQASVAQRDEWLAGAAADAAKALQSEAGGATVGDFAVLHGLYWLTANLARTGPLVLITDDLHWADEPSLRFFTYLLPRLEDLPVAMIAAARPRQPGASALLDALALAPACRLLEPGDLSASATTALLSELFGRPPQPRFSEACRRGTGGNPLLLRELVRALAVEGLEPVEAHASRVTEIGSRAVGRRVSLELARLPSIHRRMAEAMAILAPQAPLGLAARLAGTDREQAKAGVAALVSTELLRADEPHQEGRETYDFIHPLVQQATYDQIPLERRHEYHAAAAHALAQTGAGADRIATHLVRMPPGTTADTVPILRSAAEYALAGGSQKGALSYLRRALKEPLAPRDRLGILTQAAHAAARCDLSAAIEYLREALTLLDDPRAQAELAETLGLALLYTGQDEAAVDVLTAALARLPEKDDDLRRALQAILLNVPTIAVGWEHITTQLPALSRLPPARTRGALMLDCMLAAHDTYAANPSGLQRARQAIHDPRLVVTAREGATMAIGAYFSVVVGDLEEGIAAQSDLIAQARQHGSLTALCQGLNFRALCWLRRGDLTEAQTDLSEAFQTAKLTGCR
nr:AAA family ATPase [Streptomyces chartreusis]